MWIVLYVLIDIIANPKRCIKCFQVGMIKKYAPEYKGREGALIRHVKEISSQQLVCSFVTWEDTVVEAIKKVGHWSYFTPEDAFRQARLKGSDVDEYWIDECKKIYGAPYCPALLAEFNYTDIYYPKPQEKLIVKTNGLFIFVFNLFAFFCIFSAIKMFWLQVVFLFCLKKD